MCTVDCRLQYRLLSTQCPLPKRAEIGQAKSLLTCPTMLDPEFGSGPSYQRDLWAFGALADSARFLPMLPHVSSVISVTSQALN